MTKEEVLKLIDGGALVVCHDTAERNTVFRFLTAEGYDLDDWCQRQYETDGDNAQYLHPACASHVNRFVICYSSDILDEWEKEKLYFKDIRAVVAPQIRLSDEEFEAAFDELLA